MTSATTATAGRSTRTGRRFSLSWLGVVPFFAYVGLFLLLPTGLVVIQAFGTPEGQPTLSNIRALGESYVLTAFWRSIQLSFATAAIGAVAGAFLAYLVVSGPADGMVRRTVTAVAGVLAQFGGVTLAFAFMVSVGNQGLVTLLLQDTGISVSWAWPRW